MSRLTGGLSPGPARVKLVYTLPAIHDSSLHTNRHTFFSPCFCSNGVGKKIAWNVTSRAAGLLISLHISDWQPICSTKDETAQDLSYRIHGKYKMRLQQIVGKSTVSELVRSRLERNDFRSEETARLAVQRLYPHHVVVSENGKISVLVRDRSVAVAVFQQFPASTARYEQKAT